MIDDIRPRGAVERTCTKCGWSMWFDPLDPLAAALPFVCRACTGGPQFVGLPGNLKDHTTGPKRR